MEFFEHAVFGFCWWDIPGLIALVKRHKLKEEKKELESQLSN